MTAVRRTAAVLGAVVAIAALAACQPIGGGPNNTFGNDPTRSGVQPQLWASINGPYSTHWDGDPYATKCLGWSASPTSCDGAGSNPTYNTLGYLWGIDVPAALVGIPVTVAIYDPEMKVGSAAKDNLTNGNFATSYQLFNTTGSPSAINLGPANAMSTLGRCGAPTAGSHVFPAGSTESMNAWYSLCTFTPTQAGVYPLQVKTSAIPSIPDSGGGFNNFSIRATSGSGPQPRCQPRSATRRSSST